MSRNTHFSLLIAVSAALFVVAVFVWVRSCWSSQEDDRLSQAERQSTTRELRPLQPYTLVVPDIATLEQRSAVTTVPSAISSRPIPTNQWFSSLFFKENGESLYAFPWTVAFSSDGFRAGLPTIVAQPGIVTGGASSDIVIQTDHDHDGMQVETWDDLSLLTRASVGTESVFSLRITRGSPFLTLEAAVGEHFRLHTDGTIAEGGVESGQVSIEVGGRHYALYFDPTQFDTERTGSNDLSLRAVGPGALLALATLPQSSDLDRFARFALDPIISSTVEYGLSADERTVDYHLVTRSGGPTLFGLLPHHALGTLAGESENFGTFETVRGRQQLRLGKEFIITTERDMPALTLDVAGLDVTKQDILRALVRSDAGKLQFPEQDTYFAGKRLVAAAQLLSLSTALGESSVAADIAKRLRDQFRVWRDGTTAADPAGQHFAYDPVVRGVVGYPASFGSELFNDHHFHFGYFISAAAILGEYDPSFVQEFAPFINLLVQDIANTDRDSRDFPYLRNFDAYEGHSWAAGQALFPDGNNQESTSEAIQAWYGLARWATVIGSPELVAWAEALYEEESASTWAYWLHPQWPPETAAPYAAPIVSLLWGGKAEYATWFSPAPEAKIGIELLPLGSQSGYLAKDPEQLRAILDAAPFAAGAVFRDAHLMALALVDPERARSLLPEIEDRDIDTWNTRSYLTAWVMSAAVAQMPK